MFTSPKPCPSCHSGIATLGKHLYTCPHTQFERESLQGTSCPSGETGAQGSAGMPSAQVVDSHIDQIERMLRDIRWIVGTGQGPLEGLGSNFRDEQKRMAEEQAFQADQQAKLQAELDAPAFFDSPYGTTAAEKEPTCRKAPEGYFCSRAAGHSGPCCAWSLQQADIETVTGPELCRRMAELQTRMSQELSATVQTLADPNCQGASASGRSLFDDLKAFMAMLRSMTRAATRQFIKHDKGTRHPAKEAGPQGPQSHPGHPSGACEMPGCQSAYTPANPCPNPAHYTGLAEAAYQPYSGAGPGAAPPMLDMGEAECLVTSLDQLDRHFKGGLGLTRSQPILKRILKAWHVLKHGPSESDVKNIPVPESAATGRDNPGRLTNAECQWVNDVQRLLDLMFDGGPVIEADLQKLRQVHAAFRDVFPRCPSNPNEPDALQLGAALRAREKRVRRG